LEHHIKAPEIVSISSSDLCY